MKIYIATPVNARKEPTLEKKLEAALKRVNELTRIVQTHLPKAKVCSVFNAIVVRKNGQSVSEDKIMGACVRMVMACDVILMDDGWGDSHGCKVERFTAQEYGKEIWTLFDLEAIKKKQRKENNMKDKKKNGWIKFVPSLDLPKERVSIAYDTHDERGVRYAYGYFQFYNGTCGCFWKDGNEQPKVVKAEDIKYWMPVPSLDVQEEPVSKGLELTWEDIKTIDKLLNQCVDYSNPYQEVLKRFKSQKGEEL